MTKMLGPVEPQSWGMWHPKCPLSRLEAELSPFFLRLWRGMGLGKEMTLRNPSYSQVEEIKTVDGQLEMK